MPKRRSTSEAGACALLVDACGLSYNVCVCVCVCIQYIHCNILSYVCTHSLSLSLTHTHTHKHMYFVCIMCVCVSQIVMDEKKRAESERVSLSTLLAEYQVP